MTSTRKCASRISDHPLCTLIPAIGLYTSRTSPWGGPWLAKCAGWLRFFVAKMLGSHWPMVVSLEMNGLLWCGKQRGRDSVWEQGMYRVDVSASVELVCGIARHDKCAPARRVKVNLDAAGTRLSRGGPPRLALRAETARQVRRELANVSHKVALARGNACAQQSVGSEAWCRGSDRNMIFLKQVSVPIFGALSKCAARAPCNRRGQTASTSLSALSADRRTSCPVATPNSFSERCR